MIQRMSHSTIFVLDQEEAKDFYVNKLGFKVNTDATMDGGFRWLTVTPPGQPDLEIVLMGTQSSMALDEDACGKIRELLNSGKLGAGVFATSDIHKTFQDLKSKGVEFLQEPTEQFYGTEAIFKDNSGNWFSLSQEKPHNVGKA